MFFEERVLGLEEDDRGSACREGRLSFAETDVCVCETFYSINEQCLEKFVYIIPKQSFVTA
jgi:hypothetical protein